MSRFPEAGPPGVAGFVGDGGGYPEWPPERREQMRTVMKLLLDGPSDVVDEDHLLRVLYDLMTMPRPALRTP